MVGPSSSHTAGACKIGQMARAIFHGTPNKVEFFLHGSFATVYKGHSTDRALLAGVMKCKTADPLIKTAFDLAKEKKLEYEFIPTDLGPQFHPNSVKIVLYKPSRVPMAVIGSSLGGGIVQIVKIDEFDVDIKGVAGVYKTLIVWHQNDPEILQNLTKKIETYNEPTTGVHQKIHDIQTTNVGKNSLTVLNIDGRDFHLEEILELEEIPGISDVRSLTKPEN